MRAARRKVPRIEREKAPKQYIGKENFGKLRRSGKRKKKQILKRGLIRNA